MAMIQITNLTFGYEGSYDNIFEEVSFQIDTDWKLGFIGRNGRGKTTFLKLLLGQLEYSGNISSSVEFDYFPYSVQDKEQYSYEVMEQIYPEYEMWRLRKEMFLLGMEEELLYRPFGSLSNGEQTRLMLALLFTKENNFLLIDEPTNHLDMEARSVVSRYLNDKKGFIMVSHDRVFLDGCIDHVLSINKSNIEIQKGNFSSWDENRKMIENFELKKNEKLEREVKKLSAAARQTETWSGQVEKTKYDTKDSGLRPDRGFIGHKSAKMMKRSKVTKERANKAVEEKKGLLKNLEEASDLKIFPMEYHKNTMLEVINVRAVYDGRPVGEPVSFALKNGDRLAITGKNGCGKTSLLKLLLGEITEYEGRIEKGAGLVISYVPQDTSFLKGSLDDFIEQSGIDQTLFKSVLRKLDFSRVQFDKKMEAYSEGQRKKVLLAKSICTPAHMYIWDEPLNYIDILSRVQIQQLILKNQPTMIFVEHDKEFTDAVATIQR